MTISDAQSKALFGESAAWELLFIRQPTDLMGMLTVTIENPQACGAANHMLRTLRLERERRSARPTRCLLCTAHFLHRMPAALAIMSPVTRKGPSAGFALCDDCTAKPDLEERVRTYFRVKLGAQDAQWGTA